MYSLSEKFRTHGCTVNALWISKYTLFKHGPSKQRGKSKWKMYSRARTHQNYDCWRLLLMSTRTFRCGREKVTLSLLLIGIPTLRANGTITMLHTGANSSVIPTRTFRAQNYFKFSEGDQASFLFREKHNTYHCE